MYKNLQNHEDAIAVCYKKLAIYKELYGETDAEVAQVYREIALLYDRQHNYTEACALLQRALYINSSEKMIRESTRYVLT